MQSDQTNYDVGMASAGADEFADFTDAPLGLVRKPRLQQSAASLASKRLIDIVLSLAITLVFSPVILFCGLALLVSGGPVVFSQHRVGSGGHAFRVYKFRTMVPNAPQVLKELLAANAELRAEYARDHKLRNDPRVTRIGKFLRRTSLDELPQLWNVIKGEMSLVGPRPVEPFEMTKYGVHAHYYYAQRPGLTGIWQISGRSDVSYEQRVAMDTYYSRKRTVWLDLRIIVATAVVVLVGRGAH